MFDDDMPKQPKADHVLGMDLSSLSIEELEKRVVLLKEEIRRLEDAADTKRTSMSVAENFFKTS